MFPLRGTCSSVVFAVYALSKRSLCTFQAKLAIKCFAELRLRPLLTRCCWWYSSQNHCFKGVLESCIQILRKCGSAYLWGSWVLMSKGPNGTVVLNICCLCRIQTSLCSSQTSPLAYFQVAVIFKVRFVSCCKFYFILSPKVSILEKSEQKNLFIQFWVMTVWNE